MASLAVVTSSPPGAEGGHLVVARALVRAAEEVGHRASLIVTPDYGFGRTAATYLANWRADVSRFDHVISLRYPSYAVRHPSQVCWLTHAMREYYDAWPAFKATLSLGNTVKESVRRQLIHTADAWLLEHNLRRLVAMSETIRKRIAGDFGRQVEVVCSPAPQRPYRCDGYEPFIFAVSRLTPFKRMDLLVRALAEPHASGVSAVIAGEGESGEALVQLARALGVDRRITFLGRIDDAMLLDHLARCRAVCFTPLQEDYGLVTVEAFASRKAVVTCRDSGGPADLVTDNVNGLIVDATPAALADALARLAADVPLAERLGAGGEVSAQSMQWPETVARLLVAP